MNVIANGLCACAVMSLFCSTLTWGRVLRPVKDGNPANPENWTISAAYLGEDLVEGNYFASGGVQNATWARAWGSNDWYRNGVLSTSPQMPVTNFAFGQVRTVSMRSRGDVIFTLTWISPEPAPSRVSVVVNSQAIAGAYSNVGNTTRVVSNGLTEDAPTDSPSGYGGLPSKTSASKEIRILKVENTGADQNPQYTARFTLHAEAQATSTGTDARAFATVVASIAPDNRDLNIKLDGQEDPPYNRLEGTVEKSGTYKTKDNQFYSFKWDENERAISKWHYDAQYLTKTARWDLSLGLRDMCLGVPQGCSKAYAYCLRSDSEASFKAYSFEGTATPLSVVANGAYKVYFDGVLIDSSSNSDGWSIWVDRDFLNPTRKKYWLYNSRTNKTATEAYTAGDPCNDCDLVPGDEGNTHTLKYVYTWPDGVVAKTTVQLHMHMAADNERDPVMTNPTTGQELTDPYAPMPDGQFKPCKLADAQQGSFYRAPGETSAILEPVIANGGQLALAGGLAVVSFGCGIAAATASNPIGWLLAGVSVASGLGINIVTLSEFDKYGTMARPYSDETIPIADEYHWIRPSAMSGVASMTDYWWAVGYQPKFRITPKIYDLWEGWGYDYTQCQYELKPYPIAECHKRFYFVYRGCQANMYDGFPSPE